MSLTKDKLKAKEAMKVLKDVTDHLPIEHKKEYLAALETVAKYNGELRRDRSTAINTVPVVTENTNMIDKRLIQDLENTITQLRQQLKFEKSKPVEYDFKSDDCEKALGEFFDNLVVDDVAWGLAWCISVLHNLITRCLQMAGSELRLCKEDFVEEVKEFVNTKLTEVDGKFFKGPMFCRTDDPNSVESMNEKRKKEILTDRIVKSANLLGISL